jgi:hypothetical protein
MTEWAFVLTPLLVLPIVLLFRFVGCTPFGEGEPVGKVEGPPLTPSPPPTPDTKPPKYREYILGEQPNPGQVKNNGVVPNGSDVIAYWRLVDAAASPVADDAKNFQDGEYREGHVLRATPDSEGRNPAHFLLGQPSLIVSDPTQSCRFFNGGYVFVEYKPGLYTDEFTIEAWIKADVLAAGYEHVLFDAGGRYALTSPPGAPVTDRGFRIFANRDNHWQVDLGAAKNLFPNVSVPPGAQTHLAVTVANAGGTKKKVTIYVDGKVPTDGTTIVAVYEPPHEAPLFIGVENIADAPKAPLSLRHPVLCRIQEVVLHRKALSREEIENHVDINRK